MVIFSERSRLWELSPQANLPTCLRTSTHGTKSLPCLRVHILNLLLPLDFTSFSLLALKVLLSHWVDPRDFGILAIKEQSNLFQTWSFSLFIAVSFLCTSSMNGAEVRKEEGRPLREEQGRLTSMKKK